VTDDRQLEAGAIAGRSPGPPTPTHRVLVLANWFPSPTAPTHGSFVHEQAQALRRHRGLDVRVLAGRPWPIDLLRPWRLPAQWQSLRSARRAMAFRELDGVPVVDVPFALGTPLALPGTARSYARSMLAAAAVIRGQFPFTLVHAHTCYLDGTAALALRDRWQVPCVVTEHAGPFAEVMRRPWVRRAVRRVMLGADRTLAVSTALANDMRRWLPSRHGERVGVLRNGVDAERFQAPARWVPDPTHPRLVAIGALRPVKDPELLLAAFAGLLRAIPGATLQLVGDGELRAPMTRRCDQLGIAHAVRFGGSLSRDATAALLRDACDLLVVSSRAETFGLAALEALACGKPVVATRCGGPEDLVVDDTLGRLVPVGDVAAMTIALREACGALRSFEPQRIRAAALQRFALPEVARDLHAIFDEVARDQRRSA
jgi:glycosyltransferase involved in cell wall biosynthesis